MLNNIKIAAVQIEPKITAKKENLDKILAKTEIAAGNGSNLIVFPECALTGYVFSNREEVKPFAETVPGPSTNRLEKCCQKLGVYVIASLIERSVEKYFNAAVLIGPEGLIGVYRKIHLPFLGVDRFLDRGDKPFRVYETGIGNIGMHICYDCNFPESARVMTLMGADILALPTNWPEGRERIPKFVAPTRAYENKVYLVAVNRVGGERGTKFIGQSKIINTWGDTLAEASIENEEILYAEVNLTQAREKHVILKPGEFEVDLIRDRRPEFYGKIIES
jgi:5-aminopentanamidase